MRNDQLYSKVIGGKRFQLETRNATKEKVNRMAKELRSVGAYARIVKGVHGYTLWSRHERGHGY